ncbi:short-chain dehydrogenase [Alteribacter lacisalsi]|uniref:Short-chain dehydrogenase n=1 Tax=Alteribacter lacisalsi TaxID=2045244 RepID=A0A2W0H9R6_9BACI|nr:SDR family NAD(P)-dependent oxidoreductase [Alteribacter lacisalsi]PYZ97867.1 short-chain dehydrogenase [Alteribacter lacisalsi]
MKSKTVFITGTSSGFGLETAVYLAEKGFRIIAAMRNYSKENLLEQRAALSGVSDRITVMELDVTDPAQIERVKEEVQSRFGAPDVIINNAGYSKGGITETLTYTDWEEQLKTNVLGTVAVTAAFLPMMREAGGGKIINLGSISGRFGFPALGPYVTSKTALAGCSESLRLELLPQNIYMSLIEAGSYKTGIWEKGMNAANLEIPESYRGTLESMYRMAEHSAHTASDPQEVVRLIERICTVKKPRFRYQTGRGVRTLIFLKTLLPWPVIEWYVKIKLTK